MIIRATAAALALVCSGSAWAVLELNPMPHEYTAHGIIYRQLKFKDDKQTVAMDLPKGWTYRGSPARLQLVPPPEMRFADGTIEVVPFPPPAPGAEPPRAQPLDPAAMQAVEQQALASVPPGSQFTKVISKDESITYTDKPTFTVVISYQMLGETFVRSTRIVNFPDFRFLLRVSAQQRDFEQVSDTFYRSALSFTWE